jgi:uncharacterized protein (DUF1330 family)
MAFERVAALSVVNQDMYTEYRSAIRPLLNELGADFRFDFAVSQVLRGDGAEQTNRAFVLRFPDRAAKVRFFGDPRYAVIKQELFDPSVASIVVIAEYETVD